MAREKSGTGIRWRLWLSVTGWSLAFVSLGMGVRQAHRFVITDPKFVLSAEDPNALAIQGLKYTPRARVARIFAGDFGRSIFEAPLAEHRRRLLAIDWVEDASVSRIWPNRLLVRVTERKPVAFVDFPLWTKPTGLPSGGVISAARVMLIDANGVLLEDPGQGGFNFPVLTGIREDQPETERRARVRVMTRLLGELGPLAKDISEVNVESTDNLRVVAQVEGRAVDLMLGDANLGKRYRNFLTHYPEIRTRSGAATAFDLRLDDRITAKE